MDVLHGLDGKNFEEEVLRSPVPVFVFFCAAWCGLSKTTVLVIEEIAVEYQSRAKVLRADITMCPDLVERVGLDGIPALVIFHGGEIDAKIMGVKTKQQIKDKIEHFFAYNVF